MERYLGEFDFHRIVQFIITLEGLNASFGKKGLFWKDDLQLHDQQNKLNFKEEVVFAFLLHSSCHSQQKPP